MTEPAQDVPADISPELIAEHAVLGTAIRSPGGAVEALAVLRPEHFSRTAHQVVYEAAERLTGVYAGDPEEFPQAVMTELARTGMLGKVGAPGLGSGAAFLHSLMERSGSVSFHAPVVLNAARRRNIRAALQSADHVAAGLGFDADVHSEQIRKLIEDACEYAAPAVLRTNAAAVNEVLEAIEDGIAPGISTGYPDLDDVIGALRPEELIVIAGRPGGGKSLLGLCIADHVGTHQGIPVLFSSLEMTEPELTARRISAASGVPLASIVRHQVTPGEWDMIGRAHSRLTETNLHVDDTPGIGLAHIRGRLRAMRRAGDPAGLLVIDYLGYLAAPPAESRQQAVAALARDSKLLAREFRIPVILLAQLNRGLESRADKVPGMADLRESGEIEQSADIVILLHRPDAHDKETPRAGEIDLVIAKNRQGRQCTETLLFQGHYGRIVSMTRSPRIPPPNFRSWETPDD